MLQPRQSAWRVLAVLMAATLGACGEPDAGTGGGTDGGSTSTPSRVLTRVGPPSIEVLTGDVVTLQALLAQRDVGPVAGATVRWKLVKNPAGDAQFDVDTSQTDARGVATVRLTVGAVPSDPNLVIEVKAESDGANSDKAAWKLKVVKISKHLEVVPGSDVRLITPPNVGAVRASPNRSVQLVVRVLNDRDPAEPVPGETVTFKLDPYQVPPPPPGAALSGASVGPGGTVVSLGDGQAAITLAVGTATSSSPYNVVVSLDEGAGATFVITVASGPTGGCTSTTECPQGKVCRAGSCVDSTTPGGGTCKGNDTPCPLGYVCNAEGVCEHATGPGNCPTCPEGQHCEASTNSCVPDECNLEITCPGDAPCTNGICTPTGDIALDVTGHWFTKHEFKIRDALPSWVRTLAGGVRIVDQAFAGALGLPSWLNQIIAGILNQYVPEWVPKLVRLLDNALTIFSELRAEGEMDLIAVGGPRVLSGTETWSSFIFYLLEQCGNNIGGNYNNPPDCARVDIYTSDLPATAATTVKPFAARLLGSPPGTSTILMDRREVDMKLQGLIKYVLDMMGELITGEPTIEQSLVALVDCAGLASSFDWPGIEPACEAAVIVLGQVAGQALSGVNVNVSDVITFHGQATARDTMPGYPANYAEELGQTGNLLRNNDGSWKNNPSDGAWTGKFNLVNDVPGRWRASREPVTQ